MDYEDEEDMEFSYTSDDSAENPEKNGYLSREQIQDFLDNAFPAGSLDVAPYASLKEGFRENEVPGELTHTLTCYF